MTKDTKTRVQDQTVTKNAMGYGFVLCTVSENGVTIYF